MKWMIILLLAAAVLAQPQQSENFRITKSVLDAGGGQSSSANFHVVSAFGQPTPIGSSSSDHFNLSAGFLSPSFAVSPLSPIQDLAIRRVGFTANVELSWGTVAGAATYHLYRDTNPLFTPGSTNEIGITSDTIFVDVGAVGLPEPEYFYQAIVSDEPLLFGLTGTRPHHSLPNDGWSKTSETPRPEVRPEEAMPQNMKKRIK